MFLQFALNRNDHQYYLFLIFFLAKCNTFSVAFSCYFLSEHLLASPTKPATPLRAPSVCVNHIVGRLAGLLVGCLSRCLFPYACRVADWLGDWILICNIVFFFHHCTFFSFTPHISKSHFLFFISSWRNWYLSTLKSLPNLLNLLKFVKNLVLPVLM